MIRRFSTLTFISVLPVALLLSACSSNNADTFSDAIAAGASRLRSSGQTQTTVRCTPSTKKPYVVAIYPPFRSAEDEKFLDTIAPQALELSHAGAAISPKADGLLNTLVVWQQGELATFTGAFKSAAEAKQALGVYKPDGSAAEITLKREGGAVYITAIR
ncbi:MAG TPA: hypothetical protein VMT19_04705 [Thermoanaerobaculaceae bacterium]|nr:hypothetical protein [Thermoanaerobaculaceae bacterium]